MIFPNAFGEANPRIIAATNQCNNPLHQIR